MEPSYQKETLYMKKKKMKKNLKCLLRRKEAYGHKYFAVTLKTHKMNEFDALINLTHSIWRQ